MASHTYTFIGNNDNQIKRITNSPNTTQFKMMVAKYKKGNQKKAMWKKVSNALSSNSVRLSHFQFEYGDNKHLMITYLVGVTDFKLINLANAKDGLGFPRGFPIVWDDQKMKVISFGGFLSKFSNDDRNDEPFDVSGLTSVKFAKKFSGSLGLMFAFRHDNQTFVFFGAKNSTGNIYAKTLHDLLTDWYKTRSNENKFEELVKFLVQGHCLAFEVCSSDVKMGHHGALYNTSIPVALVVAKTFEDDKIVTFYDDDEAMEIFHKYELPAENRYLIDKPQNCSEFFEQLNNERDWIRNSSFNDLVQTFVEKGFVKVSKGTINHSELTDILEGLIFWLKSDSGRTIKKFKFGVYTRMTMFLRTAIGKKQLVVGESIQKWNLVNAVKQWANWWVVQEKNRERHISVMLRACEILSTVKPDTLITTENYLLVAEEAVKKSEALEELTGPFNYSTWIGSPLKVVLVIGPVGCGKSSLLMTLLKMFPDTVSTVEVDDEDENTSNGGKTKNNRVIGKTVTESLHNGKIVVIANGGGYFYSINKRTKKGALTVIDELENRASTSYTVAALIAPLSTINYVGGGCNSQEKTVLLNQYINDTLKAARSRINRGVYQIIKGYKGKTMGIFQHEKEVDGIFRKVTTANFDYQVGLIKHCITNSVPLIGFEAEHRQNGPSNITFSGEDKLVEICSSKQPTIELPNNRWTFGYTTEAVIAGTVWRGHITSGYGLPYVGVQKFMDQAFKHAGKTLKADVLSIVPQNRGNRVYHCLAIKDYNKIDGLQQWCHMTINTPYPPVSNGTVIKSVTPIRGGKTAQVNIKNINYTVKVLDQTVNVEIKGVYSYPV